MYHSYLVVDTGGNPDRPRPGRKWLRNIYNVHQRLCMGFPRKEQLENDRQFLFPYNPTGFVSDSASNEIHVQRVQEHRPHFLFRIDHIVQGNKNLAVILVQSDLEPCWDYAFYNARVLLANVPLSPPVQYQPIFKTGAEYRFRIHVCLSRKSKNVMDANGEKILLDKSKRLAFNWESDRDKEIQDWFHKKALGNATKVPRPLGFEPEVCIVMNVGWSHGWKNGGGSIDPNSNSKTDHALKFRSALLEGTLRVTDPEAFLNTIKTGIGSAKAFGFGLLSVAPMSQE